MKLNELIQKRADVSAKMDELLKGELTAEVRAQVNNLEKEYDQLGQDIETVKRQAERSKTITTVVESNKEKSLGQRWIEAFKNYANTNVIDPEFRGNQGGMIVPLAELRTDPLLSTTNTAVINKTVAPLSVKVPAGLDWLRAMGATFDENLNGNYVLPSLSTIAVGFVAEGSDTPSAAVDTPTNTLASRILGGNQVISRQMLSQTNPNLLAGILNGIELRMGEEVVKDGIANIKTDFPQCKVQRDYLTDAPSYAKLLALDSSIRVSMTNPVYVMSKQMKNYLKGQNAASANIKFIVDDNNTIAGIPVWAHPDVSTNSIFLLDAPDFHVGTFGTTPTEIIIDNYSSKKSGKIEFQILTQVDSGYSNPLNLCWYDASTTLQ